MTSVIDPGGVERPTPYEAYCFFAVGMEVTLLDADGHNYTVGEISARARECAAHSPARAHTNPPRL